VAKEKGKLFCLPELAGKNKELLQRSLKQSAGKPFHLNALERRQLLRAVKPLDSAKGFRMACR
jgi:hypothetical protein